MVYCHEETNRYLSAALSAQKSLCRISVAAPALTKFIFRWGQMKFRFDLFLK